MLKGITRKRKYVLFAILSFSLIIMIIGIYLDSIALFLFMSGKGDHSLPLNNGFVLHRFSAAEVFIGKGLDGHVIPPSIQEMDIVGSFVIGKTIKTMIAYSVDGYFLLDMRTGQRSYGLSIDEWEKKLNTRGIIDYELRFPGEAIDIWRQSSGDTKSSESSGDTKSSGDPIHNY
jgi:hypothetical protein